MEIEHDNEAETIEDSIAEVDENTEEVEPEPCTCTWTDKTVRQLKKDERSKLIEGFNNGVEDPYFKVMRMKNGQMRITKRSNPLQNDADNAHEVVTEKVQKQFQGKRLTDNQLLFEHIIDLERKMVEMRFKHKKLKKRYNKLEQDIFDDSDEDTQKVMEVEVDYSKEMPEQTPVPEPESVPEIRLRNPRKKANWRTYIQSM